MSKLQFTAAIAAFVTFGSVMSAELDPSAIKMTLPDKIPWVENERSGSAAAILAGDPSKPGIYVELTKWHAGHMSRPHFHQNDRFIYVVSGTWWVGWGKKYNPDSTYPIPAGGLVRHYGKQIHYDGSKSEGCILEIMGEGPATPTEAEEK